MKKILFLSITIALSLIACKKNKPLSYTQTGFLKTYGGVTYNKGAEAIETSDGGYIIAATSADGGTLTSTGSSSADLVLIKTDARGNVSWKKSYGGPYFDECGSVTATPEGYLLLGTYSFRNNTGTMDPSLDSTNLHVIMTDLEGNIRWEKNLNGVGTQNYSTKGMSVCSSSVGFVLIGTARIESASPANSDVFCNLVLSDGTLMAEPFLIGSATDDDEPLNVLYMPSNAQYLVSTNTFIGQKTPRLQQLRLTMGAFLPTNAPTNSDWSTDRTLSVAGKITLASDGNYVLTGTTDDDDIFVLKLDHALQKTSIWYYGEPNYKEQGMALANAMDGGYVVAGITNNPNTIGTEGKQDNIYVVKIDGNGNKVWEKTFGNEGFETVSSIHQTADGGFVLCGTLDVGNNGVGSNLSKSILMIKLGQDGNMLERILEE